MKFITLLSLVLLAALLGGIYGALYDQLTYTISPEFFTKFRFEMFKITPEINNRGAVAYIGFLNTWKAGAVLGAVLALAGLINADNKRMFRHTMLAFGITLFTAFVTGLLGWLVSGSLNQTGIDPELHILDTISFHKVITMNNFSYAGGVAGMFIGIFYQLYSHKRFKDDQVKLHKEIY